MALVPIADSFLSSLFGVGTVFAALMFTFGLAFFTLSWQKILVILIIIGFIFTLFLQFSYQKALYNEKKTNKILESPHLNVSEKSKLLDEQQAQQKDFKAIGVSEWGFTTVYAIFAGVAIYVFHFFIQIIDAFRYLVFVFFNRIRYYFSNYLIPYLTGSPKLHQTFTNGVSSTTFSTAKIKS